MLDIRDLEVPAAQGPWAPGAGGRGVWEHAPDAVRAAGVVLVPLIALAVLRVWLVATQWPDFLRAYGQAHHLDMTSSAGWVEANLHAPGQWGAVLDLAAVLAIAVFVVACAHRWCGARTVAVALACAVGVDVVASLAYAVPWWYDVSGAEIELALCLLVVMLARPGTTMHLRPDPVTLTEA